MLLALAQSAAHLTVQPWTGNDFQSTTDAAAKYRLEVGGKPDATLRLRAVGVAPGWLAAFCTPRLCSPQQVEVRLPASGNAVFQFELIRESQNAPKRSGATITDDDGASVKVPAAYRG
jgi:hypothetical protein